MKGFSFNTDDIVLVVAGIHIDGGFGDNKVTIARSNDVTSIIEGVDGDVVFATSNKKSGTLSFDLLYNSIFDSFMGELAAYKGLFPISFADTNTGKVLVSYGKVMTQPDLAINETPDNRTWSIVLVNVDMSISTAATSLKTAISPYFPA